MVVAAAQVLVPLEHRQADRTEAQQAGTAPREFLSPHSGRLFLARVVVLATGQSFLAPVADLAAQAQVMVVLVLAPSEHRDLPTQVAVAVAVVVADKQVALVDRAW